MQTKVFELPVHIPSADDVAAKYPTYGNLVRNEGKFLFDLIMSPESYVRARVATEDFELPAVAGVAKICFQTMEANPTDKKFELLKQFIGAVVCVLMEANGFEKTGTKKAVPHHAFTKGEFYRKSVTASVPV